MKNICYLDSFSKDGWNKVLAINPSDCFKAKLIKKNVIEAREVLSQFKKFVDQNTKKGRTLIGFFSYDFGACIHDVKLKSVDDIKLPDIYFLAFDSVSINVPFLNSRNPDGKNRSKKFKSTITKTEYKKAFKGIKRHIREGNIYQINLTHRLSTDSSQNSRSLFNKIRKNNHVDFLAYIEGDGFEIMSASPERFVKIKNRMIKTSPIKGTRPRGRSKSTDEKLKKDLLNSEKEKAELNMITDLLRNDLGEICKIGSVKVVDERLLKKYESVWHTHSNITGIVDDKFSTIDALVSMLPGGSITGCPKRKAIEIIDELEKTSRGVYTGIIGYIKPNLDLDFSIAIRTVIKKKNNLYLQVGGGIVLDSNEKAEYEETMHKAASFMKILD